MGIETPAELDELRRATRRTWTLGDYRRIAQRQWSVATDLCDWAQVGAGDQVLDVGTATGNVAIAAARRGAHATGLDLTPQMLQEASGRAGGEALNVVFVLGDAEALPFPDRSFDVVLSACGLWFAPRPERAVAEALRVLRPGGRIGLANFTPTGYMGRLNELITAQLPLPEGVPEPNLWGREEVAVRRLSAFEDVATTTGCVEYAFGSAPEASEFFGSYSPPHIAAAEALGPNAAGELFDRIQTYTEEEFSTADGVRIPAEYLLVRGRAPGSAR